MDENVIFIKGVGTVVGVKHDRQEARQALFYAVERIAELERDGDRLRNLLNEAENDRRNANDAARAANHALASRDALVAAEALDEFRQRIERYPDIPRSDIKIMLRGNANRLRREAEGGES